MTSFLRGWRGRWQVPALIVGLAAFAAGAVLLYRPAPPTPLDAEIARIGKRRDAGGISPEQAQGMLSALGGERPDALERADFWLETARCRWQMLVAAGGDATARAAVAGEVAEAYRRALDLGLSEPLVARATFRLGRALRAVGQLPEAADALRKALAANVAEPWRTRRILLEVESERGRHAEAEKIARTIETNPAAGEYLRTWAAARRFELMINQKRSDEVIDELTDGWAARPPRIVLAYGRALWMAGRDADAERVLRAVRQAASEEAEPEVDGVAAFLLGRIRHANGEGDATEARAFFAIADQRYAGTPIAAACRWGLARTAATLHDFDGALDTYKDLIGLLADGKRNPWVSGDDVRDDLRGLWDQFSKATDFARAARAAVLLSDQAGPEDPEAVQLLAETLRAHGEVLKEEAAALAGDAAAETRVRSRKRFVQAGRQFLRLAELRYENDPLYQNARWLAIVCFNEAADSATMIALLEQFIHQKPTNNPRLPDARLRLGQACYATKQFERAEAVLRANVQDPNTRQSPATYASYVPLARCYLSLGREFYPKAEQILLRVVEGNELGIGPRSEHFKAASFLLGEVYYRMNDYPRALKRLAEAVGMYPTDERVTVALYYVADCSRRQAAAASEALETAKKQVEIDLLIAQRIDALHKAAATFRRVIDAIGPKTVDDDGVAATYLRNACFFEADCLYAVGEYERAIELYEDAIFRYRARLESALACISMFNACGRLGMPQRGRIYVRRGMKLLEKMPEPEFVRFRGMYTRDGLMRELGELLRVL